MLIIKNKFLPLGKNYYAINLFGILLAKGDCNSQIINHEKIHTRQMMELLIIPFYLLYLLEWLIKLIKYKNNYKAYKTISFEREAYSNQNNPSYLTSRKSFAFLRYL